MPEQLKKMVDSSACFYLGNVDIWIQQGIGKRCPKITGEYVSLKAWYGNEPDCDCPYYLFRGNN